MHNKRGQFFALYIVALVLVMIGLSIWIDNLNQAEVKNSIVSPVDLLKIVDEKDLREVQELILIKDKICELETDWSNSNFVEGFREDLEGIDNFLLESVSKTGNVVEVKMKPRQRNGIGLKPIKDVKNSFSMKMNYKFESVYEINLNEVDC